MTKDSLVSVFNRAGDAVSALTEQGFTVMSIMIRDSAPRIQIARHQHCEQLIRNGKATYRYLGRNSDYRQGMFMHCGCQVFWSESLH
ncbi:hypothetical protein Ppb6_04079 [Photorhabdus australis subsp. thailandensis]|uniref:Uncharacterized protein n=1 Tax=Photorhabdus australis subsp. thailandensis TaxID=2805096 RepID=A0A1C0TZ84_9GAMM|nr:MULTISPECIES: hypothetical protein [Photorhabdus]MBS9435536.1 hypothetical protein [Photorhabdus hainanensis]NRN26723.1 hypothetical protein [Photorhabdus heterorhabditis subsp. aluminescens]OCQ50981.1 hypothetical protein Ppb6_04079 [Photorhabdus australis subsp. thailandensis]